MYKVIVVAAALAVPVAIAASPESGQGAEHVAGAKIIKDCSGREHPRFCRWRRHRLMKIRPHVGWFLGPTGACESGTDHNLRHGLRATSSTGQYLGRYQFGQPDWYRAGGVGDPRNASWLEQAYRAVVWLYINGRSSWPNC